MANHKQAEKRSRQSAQRQERNRHLRSTVRTYVKRVRSLITENNKDEAKKALAVATQWLDKAAQKGLFHSRTASRTISRLTVAVNKIFAA